MSAACLGSPARVNLPIKSRFDLPILAPRVLGSSSINLSTQEEQPMRSKRAAVILRNVGGEPSSSARPGGTPRLIVLLDEVVDIIATLAADRADVRWVALSGAYVARGVAKRQR